MLLFARTRRLLRHFAPALTERCAQSLPPPTLSRVVRYSSRSPPQRQDKHLGIVVGNQKGKGSGYCYGCGADLVKLSGRRNGPVMEVQHHERTGYWAERHKLIKISRIKNWSLCSRCKKLREATDLEGVQDLAPSNKMTRVFQQQVSKIRKQEKAVVVLCVDAINCSGTVIRTIRNYIGGNPVLLAVTRCDLLPDYVLAERSNEELRTFFREQANGIFPAKIYLCSESKAHMKQFGGIKDLANDLWQHLNGREPYIVGSANIGKSTLTDILIAGFINRGEREGHFTDGLSKARLRKLREARVTKSSLPGTTLQNVRFPCFQDHTQALWDTPGLLLDQTMKHFPINDLPQIRSIRPKQIQPTTLKVSRKSFALVVFETDDPDQIPLLRLEVRQKKKDEDGEEGPVSVVWNSTLTVLSTKIMDIQDCQEDEEQRSEEAQRRMQEFMLAQPGPIGYGSLSAEERMVEKERRRKEYETRIRKEQEEMGENEWYRREEAKRNEQRKFERMKKLRSLEFNKKVVVDGGQGVDISVAHFGWFGILSPRKTMLSTYSPSNSLKVEVHPTLALPDEFGPYTRKSLELDADEKNQASQDNESIHLSDMEDEVDDLLADLYSSDDDDDMNSALDGHKDYRYGFDTEDINGYEDLPSIFHYERGAPALGKRFRPNDKQEEFDPWKEFSGKRIGWTFDADTRWAKGRIEEGWNPIRTSRDKQVVRSKNESDSEEFLANV